jgi:hypothetical protein
MERNGTRTGNSPEQGKIIYCGVVVVCVFKVCLSVQGEIPYWPRRELFACYWRTFRMLLATVRLLLLLNGGTFALELLAAGTFGGWNFWWLELFDT